MPSSGNMRSLSGDEMLFGQILIKKGHATREQVMECLRIQASGPKDAQGRPMKLGDIMMKRGYIAMEAIEEALRIKSALTTLVCPICGNAERMLIYDPAKSYHCKAQGDRGICGAALKVHESGKTVGPASSTPRPSFTLKAIPEEVREAAANPKRNFGKYVMLKEIGRGGMGAVYKAWDTALGRMVAVKLLTGDVEEDDIQRFFREAQTAGSINHPNIAGVFDVGQQDDKYYLSMHFIEGHNLAGEKMPAKKACEVVRIIALAVEHAHQLNIVHRDIKPHNIMLDTKGHAWIMDFGLAKSLKGKSQITQSGMVMGTPSYMSPEQAQGKQSQIGKKSDVYSLGATLYELVTGRPPFKGANPLETMMQVVHKEPTPPSMLNPKIPHELEVVVLKCMEKNPMSRYPSAKALADDLGRILRGDAILAQAPTMATRLRKRLRKNRQLLIPAIAGVFLVLAVGIGLFAFSTRQTQKAHDAVVKADKAFDAGSFDEALGLYNQAKSLNPDNAKVKERIRICENKLEEVRLAGVRVKEEAERKKREVEELERKRKDAAPIFQKGKEKLEEAEKDLYRPGADLEVSRRKAAEAIGQFDEALKLFPDYADALYYRGRAHLMRLDMAKAETDFSKAVAAASNFAPALVARGKLQIRRWMDAYIDGGGGNKIVGKAGQMGEDARKAAIDDFTAASKAGEREKRHAFNAMLCFAERRFADCISSCDFAVAENPTDEETWKLKGDAIYFASGINMYGQTDAAGAERLKEAVAAYDEAIKLRTNFPEARAMRSHSYLAIGRQKEAIEDLEAAVKIDPKNFLANVMLAQIAKETGDVRRSVSLYTTAIEVKPDTYIARVNRSVAYAALQDWGSAKRDIEDAIQVNPDHVWAWQLKGAVLGKEGKYAEAEEVLTKALDMDSTNPTIWYNRAAMRDNQAKKQEAIEDYEEAIRRGHPRAAELRQRIAVLRGT